MANAALVLSTPDAGQEPETFTREQRFPLITNFSGTRAELRAFAVGQFRELADKLEREELDGARVQWRTDGAELVTVTVSPVSSGENTATVQLTTVSLAQVEG